jgi:CheY-like chemotaxis protein
VVAVENGALAVDAALAEEFDLIFMDMQMPVLDGLTATQTLRGKNYRKPIVALTANTMPEDRERYLKAGADDFIAKPVKRAAIFTAIERYLNTSEDETTGKESIEHDETEYAEIANYFVDRLPGYLNDVLTLFAHEQIGDLLKVIHDLKGTGAAFGHPRITELAQAIEAHLQNGRLPEAESVIDEFRNYCEAQR